MKALKLLLQSEKIDTTTLRALFEQDGLTTFALTSDGWDAIDLWSELRALVPKTRRWPVLVGNPGEEDVPTNRGRHYSDGKEPDYPNHCEHLEQAEQIDFSAWLAEQHRNRVEGTRADAEAEGEEGDYFRAMLRGAEEFHGIPRGRWPTRTDPDIFEAIAAPMKFTEDMDSKDVTVALLPVAEGWKTPAILQWGGWNGTPGPELHCAALRYFEREYGAELVAITSDELELRVTRPPRDRPSARRVAKEHYLYCSDRIDQQEEHTLEKLAAKLLDGEAWYFWWD